MLRNSLSLIRQLNEGWLPLTMYEKGFNLQRRHIYASWGKAQEQMRHNFHYSVFYSLPKIPWHSEVTAETLCRTAVVYILIIPHVVIWWLGVTVAPYIVIYEEDSPPRQNARFVASLHAHQFAN